MSILQKSLAKEHIELLGDALPKSQRTVKVFRGLMAAIRAAEAELMDHLSRAERELNESLRHNLELQERVRVLEGENLRHRLKQNLDEISALTTGDKTKLLELSRPVQNGGKATTA